MNRLEDSSQAAHSLRVQSKADLFSFYSIAEDCKNEDPAKACRYLEVLKDLSRTRPTISDINWESKEIADFILKCNRNLAKLYFELKLFRHVIPLLEKVVWNEVEDMQAFFIEVSYLIKSYVQIEEYNCAVYVANIVEKHFPFMNTLRKEDAIDLLLAMIEAHLGACHDRLDLVIPLCDNVLTLTRDGNFPEQRISAFLAKSAVTHSSHNLKNATVLSEQAMALAQSSRSVQELSIAKAKLSTVNLYIRLKKYAEALGLLEEIYSLARSESSLILTNKVTMARAEYYSGLCHHESSEGNATDLCSKHLEKAAKLALSAKTAKDQALLVDIWELLAELYHRCPNFIQMEHGRKCMLQVLSDCISKLLANIDACEPVSSSLVTLVSKTNRLYLEFECLLSDPKLAIDTVEWARNSLILSKVPCRRLANKLARPLTHDWIERLISRYDKRSLFLYFADSGKDTSRALCVWVLVPKRGCVLFFKLTASSSKSGKSLSELICDCLRFHSHRDYTSERRLLPKRSVTKLQSSTNHDVDRSSLFAELAEFLFSKLSTYFTDEIENVFIFPDGPLLALTPFFGELVNLWAKLSSAVPPPFLKKVFLLPSILFLEICLENQLASMLYEDEHYKSVQASKLGGLHPFFENERKSSNNPDNSSKFTSKQSDLRRSLDESKLANVKALARPRSGKIAMGAHTISTLTTKSSSGGDVCSSSLYTLASSNLRILPYKAIFFANPSLPNGTVPVNGIAWHPHLLASAEREATNLSKQLYSPYLYLGTRCTKDLFMECCHSTTLMHLATYVSYIDGVVAFSFPSVEAIKPNASRENIFSPMDVSSAKLVPSEIACLPLSRTKLVTISACFSAAELAQTIELSQNHIANSVYILPAAFLLAGAHAVMVPQLGLTDNELINGFLKLYSKKQLGASGNNNAEANNENDEYFCSTIGINSLLDMRRLAHGMLDQQIQQAVTKAIDEREHLSENDVFMADGSAASLSKWFEKMKYIVSWMTRHCPSIEDLILVRAVIENPPKSNEMGEIPESNELRQFLKWLGFHIVSMDDQLRLVFAPLEISRDTSKLAKTLMLIEVVQNLLFTDSVLRDAVVDLLGVLTIEETADFLNFFSIAKHTNFAIQMTDKTARRLFENPRSRSFLHLIGFFNVRNSVLFRASADNCKRLDTSFKLFVAILYAAHNDVLTRFVPMDVPATPEAKNKDEQIKADAVDSATKLQSLNYIEIERPTLTREEKERRSMRRIITAEPIYHLSDGNLQKSEIDAKIDLTAGISEAIVESRQQLQAAKNVFTKQRKTFDQIAPTIVERNIERLPNRVTSDRIKVQAGGTPSQTRFPIGYHAPMKTGQLNEEREKLTTFFNETVGAVELAQRQKIEKLVDKYVNKKPVSSS